ncbi:acyl carrier protein [Peptoniphilus olsenii]|uniref:Acyl carrier protein n=1 Tax=Peptoniphilus olsenii TaxID=411570 RepID=A0ABV2J7Z4_9FIRM
MNLEQLKDIICENFGVDREDIKPEANMQDDLGLDSLDAVELSMAIEEKYDITIEDDDFQNFVTIGDLLNYLNK